MALVLILCIQAGLAISILLLKPPWEPNDEIDHVRNIEAIADGHLYKMTSGSGLEANQPPLYYALLAGWQRAFRAAPRTPVGVADRACDIKSLHGEKPACWLFRHDTAADAADERLVRLLRIPSVLLALATTVFTAAAARRLSRDPWTPVVAAGVVVGVTRFEFVSGAVANDMLVNALAAAGTYLVARALSRRAAGADSTDGVPLALGVVVAALLLTKLTGTLLIPGFVLGAALSGRNRREALRAVAILGAVALALSGWWLLRNVQEHGDPIALSATTHYLHTEDPLEFGPLPAAERAFHDIPRELWSGFWYKSVHVQLSWWLYMLFWALSVGGAACLLVPVRHAGPGPPRAATAVLFLLAFGGLATLWVIGLNTLAAQARHVFPALPPIACLVALGYERVRVPVPVRFILPVLGTLTTVVIIVTDVANIPK